ncbi:Large-conductance mechanosensitive channel [compost metagenome]|jgi:large conductance mechanosensitive channel protein|uniref:Large-conductance mechanosensitive channel n=1 Tax=Sphingobacterium detergens TaxID=1145106 RepID=A0A420B793_SPHD1|nr:MULTISPECIES: large-conductance mechanosensitive channel protein MscL [Sphingobacterium]MCS4228721.1 large conductance mechanosensitive channel [Sphingobacterium sp. BIGb0165]RKE52561.1 large conductance mechanosensitive channel [Sphingobacterium detergens]
MGFLKEFKEFAMRGSVVDLAVGVVIGGAFGKIVTSLVDDIIMPPIGYLTGGVDFASKKIILKVADEATKQAEVSINYGNFINVVIQFIIVALCIFTVIKALNSLKRKEEAAPAAPAAPTKEETLLTEIRDILKTK